MGYSPRVCGAFKRPANAAAGCGRGRAGSDFALPYKAEWRTGFLTNRLAERTIPWEEVRRFYSLRYKVNGLPFGQALVLDTAQGRFNFGGHFRESADAIVAFIEARRQARPR